MKVKPHINVDCSDDGWTNGLSIQLDRPRKKYKQKRMVLDEQKVLAIVKKLKLDTANLWADCWRDDDSPQAEKTFGCRKFI